MLFSIGANIKCSIQLDKFHIFSSKTIKHVSLVINVIFTEDFQMDIILDLIIHLSHGHLIHEFQCSTSSIWRIVVT